MKVDSATASILQQPTKTRNHDQQVQSIFSEILEAAGRSGYASAEKLEGVELTTEDVQDSWSSWFNAELSGRYASVNRPEQLKQAFGEVLAQAHAEGGYVEPKQFLKGLSKGQLQAVQNAHWLADPIDVNSLTEEGALNLLLPGAAQVDLNNDGLTQSGAAYGMKFPDSNTPTKVVEAWEEATANLSFGEKMIYELQMMLPIMTANMFLDENGAYSHHYEPGDPEFRNPMAEAGYSYRQATQDQLDHLEFVKNWIPQEQYDRQTEFWQSLQGLLDEKGAN